MIQIEDPVAGSSRESQFEAANFSTKQLFALAISFVAPQLGTQIASLMGVSQAVGTAIASTALQVANGTPLEDALKGAIGNAVIQTGSASIATEINNSLKTVVSDQYLRESISNAAGSAVASGLTAAARGGNASDIFESAIAGAAGSGIASASDSKMLGSAFAGAITGGTYGALSSAVGALGSEAAKEQALQAKINAAQSAGGVTESEQATTDTTEGSDVSTESQAGDIDPGAQQLETQYISSSGYQPDVTTSGAVTDAAGRTITPEQTQTLSKVTVTGRDYELDPVTVSGSQYELDPVTVTGNRYELDPVTVTGSPDTEQTTSTKEKKESTYKPGLLTTSTVTRPSNTLARVLQGGYYPMSSTGLTAYRPAGEIESEETGKDRQDVWNEASLRLKDALGL